MRLQRVKVVSADQKLWLVCLVSFSTVWQLVKKRAKQAFSSTRRFYRWVLLCIFVFQIVTLCAVTSGLYLSGILRLRFSSYIWNTLRVIFDRKWASWDMMTSFTFVMTFLILISIIYQFRFLHLTSVWHKIDIAEVSFLWLWCYLPMITDVIIMKMLSLPLSRHKKRSSKGFISPWSFVLCEYLIVMTYLREFQLWRIFFSLRE